MNLCFLMGKIASEIKFDFVITGKSIGKDVSVVNFWVDVFGEKINVIGYNKVADYCYQKLDVGDNVFIEGFVSKKVEIKNIDLL